MSGAPGPVAGEDTASGVAIRAAAPGDERVILSLIRALADYEKLLELVEATPAGLAAALFADRPRIFCDLAEIGGRPVGFALWFYNFSTFLGRPGIYLEDLFVEPSARRLGIGKALFRHLARRCVAEGLGRLEWSVLDWNSPAIDFYRGQGAEMLDEWTMCRLTGARLRMLAEGDL